MTFRDPSTFLRRVLWADAACTLASAALHLAAMGSAPAVLRIPAALWTGTGVFFIGYGLLVAWLALQPQPPRAWVTLCAAGNAGWALACVVAILVLQPSGWGVAWIAAQGACVLLLADLQWMGLRALRRTGGMAAA